MRLTLGRLSGRSGGRRLAYPFVPPSSDGLSRVLFVSLLTLSSRENKLLRAKGSAFWPIGAHGRSGGGRDRRAGHTDSRPLAGVHSLSTRTDSVAIPPSIRCPTRQCRGGDVWSASKTTNELGAGTSVRHERAAVGANEIGAEPGTRGAPYFAQRPCQPHGVTERALTTIDACLLHGARPTARPVSMSNDLLCRRRRHHRRRWGVSPKRDCLQNTRGPRQVRSVADGQGIGTRSTETRGALGAASRTRPPPLIQSTSHSFLIRANGRIGRRLKSGGGGAGSVRRLAGSDLTISVGGDGDETAPHQFASQAVIRAEVETAAAAAAEDEHEPMRSSERPNPAAFSPTDRRRAFLSSTASAPVSHTSDYYASQQSLSIVSCRSHSPPLVSELETNRFVVVVVVVPFDLSAPTIDVALCRRRSFGQRLIDRPADQSAHSAASTGSRDAALSSFITAQQGGAGRRRSGRSPSRSLSPYAASPCSDRFVPRGRGGGAFRVSPAEQSFLSRRTPPSSPPPYRKFGLCARACQAVMGSGWCTVVVAAAAGLAVVAVTVAHHLHRPPCLIPLDVYRRPSAATGESCRRAKRPSPDYKG
uniref:Uncharacterized protein n=1 Tax=Plectus sambesii TaxID=2011161 RepID=A0A914VKQ1_9BILA